MSSLRVETIEMGPIQTNCHVVWAEGDAACWIVDPGGPPKPAIRLIEREGLTPALIVITHGHWDHFLGNKGLKDRWPDVPIAIHQVDAPALDDPNVNASMSFLGRLVKSPPADRLLADGDRLTLGNAEFQVMSTPGHSPGSVCLYCHSERIAFVGDLIFAGGGVGRTDLPRGSESDLYASIDAFLGQAHPETILYSGHGPATRADRERALLVGGQ